jgi:NAD(P)-dependent dehydrogenase (short-subunit alcohol dehydrogenase family)
MTEWKLALPEQVVVTGTSSGLGREIARLLTSAGVSVYGVDTAAPAEDLASTANFTVVQGSVTDTGTWRHTIAAVTAGARGLARLCGLGGRARRRGPR